VNHNASAANAPGRVRILGAAPSASENPAVNVKVVPVWPRAGSTDGVVQAWRLADGEKAWNNEQLRFRDLSAPLVVGRSVAVGDLQGYVHMLSREDGKVLARLSTDGSAISSRPVLAGNTLVVLTRSGGVFGFAPQ
jgi:outer membrane protein assembly factor BamB